MFHHKSTQQLKRKPSQFEKVLCQSKLTYTIDRIDNIEETLQAIVDDAISRENVAGEDWINIFIFSPNLPLQEPVCITRYFQKYVDFNFDLLLHQLSRVDQSSGGLILQNEISVTVYRVVCPTGNGRRKPEDKDVISISKRVRI